MKKSHVQNIVIIFIILCVYIGLPLLIMFGYINFNYKFYVLTCGGLLVYIVSRLIGFSNYQLGITKKNTILSIKHVLPLTIVLAIIGVILYFSGYSRIEPNEKPIFFLFYIFVSSPIQELLYRGVLESYYDKLNFNVFFKALLTSLLYSFVHIIYRDVLTMILTFMIGLIWYHCYKVSAQ